MPEYSQIQTCIKYNKDNFMENIARYKRFLIDIKCFNDDVEKWINKIKWNKDEEGYVYMPDCLAVKCKFDDTCFNIRPCIVGWISNVNSCLNESWLQFDLLFETESIYDYLNNKYNLQFQKVVFKIMREFFRCFNDIGIFLTDECTDGVSLEKITYGEDNIWGFDAAIISNSFSNKFNRVPSIFTIESFGEGTWFVETRKIRL